MYSGVTSSQISQRQIVLVGIPNAGKTTLFNTLTGLKYKVANYPGVTVSHHEGQLKASFRLPLNVVDTPGIASLYSGFYEQKKAVQFLFQQDPAKTLILAVVDATQLGRHLYLVEQLLEVGFRVVVAISMADLLQKKGFQAETQILQKILGVPCVALDCRSEMGCSGLFQVLETYAWSAPIPPLQKLCPLNPVKIRERHERLAKIEQQVLRPLNRGTTVNGSSWDRIMMHPVLGLLIFLSIMTGIFTAVFWCAQPLMDGIDLIFGKLIETAKHIFPQSWITDLLADGIIGGMNAVVIFLPQIIILFLALGILEDSGYLARGAMLIDRPLSAIGLNGRAFVPLLSGFACAIPAIMATRTIPNRLERILTITIIPLMSCSARLPVYSLLMAFLTPRHKPWIGGLGMALLYVLSIAVGSGVATLIAHFKGLKKRTSAFMLELPQYRWPQTKVIYSRAYYGGKEYLQKAGPTIIMLSLGLWVFTHLPVPSRDSTEQEYVAVSYSYAAKTGRLLEPLMEPMGLDWRAGVAIMMGFAAREVFVSAMALMYRTDENSGLEQESMQRGLIRNMRQVTFDETDQPIFTTASCLGLVVFFLVALQCFPTLVTVKNEIGAWKIPLFQLFAYSGGAYILSIILVQTLRYCGIQ